MTLHEMVLVFVAQDAVLVFIIAKLEKLKIFNNSCLEEGVIYAEKNKGSERFFAKGQN
jgi:hypothetical protein